MLNLGWTRALGACAFLLLLAAGAAAQTPAPNPFAEQSGKLDGVRANLDQIEKALSRKDLSDAALLDLRGGLEPLPQGAQSVFDDLQPKLDAIRARIDQLGAKPAAGAGPENPEVAGERAEQQKQYEAIDAVLKRAGLLTTQIGQNAEVITARRRELFTKALFARTSSILDPRLWLAVGVEAPRDVKATQTVAGDWFSSIGGKLAGLNAAIVAGAALALAIAYALAIRVAHRINPRDPGIHDPSPRRKAIAAAWVGLADAATPILAAFAALGLARSFDLFGERMEPLASALLDAAARVALAIAVSGALLAPGLINWRPLEISDATADRLRRAAILVAVIVSAGKLTEAWLQIIGAGLRSSIALRGAGAVAVAALAALALRDLALNPDDDECLPPRVTAGPDWRGPLRAAGWLAVILVIGAAIGGYIALAAFLVDQGLWALFICAAAFLAGNAGEQSIEACRQPHSPVGRAMLNSVGLRRDSLDQIAALLSGGLTLALALAALTFILAPWGVESDDMFGGIRAAFFGFKVGEVTISLSSILVALAVFSLAWALTSALQRWLEVKFLPHTRLDSGLRNSIRTSVGYVGVLGAFAIALGYLGLSFDKLAIVAGALSVGIGFGLQSIVNNFVSGLILLWERAIRVGDWVVLGDEQGYVRRINVRSTEIETFDRAVMIVPNSNLVSGVVKNWVRNDRVGRVKVAIAVTTSADPAQVRDVLLASAAASDLILKTPAPIAFFAAMADNSLKFELACFVQEVESSGRARSDLNFEILQRLRGAGIELFSPPTQVSLMDIGRIEEALRARQG